MPRDRFRHTSLFVQRFGAEVLTLSGKKLHFPADRKRRKVDQVDILNEQAFDLGIQTRCERCSGLGCGRCVRHAVHGHYDATNIELMMFGVHVRAPSPDAPTDPNFRAFSANSKSFA